MTMAGGPIALRTPLGPLSGVSTGALCGPVDTPSLTVPLGAGHRDAPPAVVGQSAEIESG